MTTIEISDFSKKMKVNDTQTISASLYPADAKEQAITYSSSDSNVAIVSEGGTVTAVGKGTAIITVSAGTAVKELNVTVYVTTKKKRFLTVI